MASWLRTIFVVLVLACWLAAFLVDLISPEYQPPPELTPLILGVATAVLGAPVVKEWRDRDK